MCSLEGRVDDILEQIYDWEPKIYSSNDLGGDRDLFKERTGLFFTPTENIPSSWVGEGVLDVVLPLASPTIYDWMSNPAYRVPRLWVDLLQRATGKLRWTPVSPAKVTMVRYDTSAYNLMAVQTGAKALLDSLIVKAAGRRDGMILHYFGAIRDDNFKDFTHGNFYQVLVERSAEARTRVIVEPAPPEEVEAGGIKVFAPGYGELPC